MSTIPTSIPETIKEMERGKSVLLTFGEPGRVLKRQMAFTGFICRVLLFIIFNPVFLLRARIFPKAWTRRKARAVWAAGYVFPYRLEGHKVEPSPNGQIFIINHPTLNDPLCALIYALRLYPDREIILPVNLPWFEGICRYRSKMRKIGINIVPILTPKTAQRLGLGDNSSKLQTALVANYIAELTDAMSKGSLAVVAQQATRQRFLFVNPAQAETGEGVLSTISLVLVGIKRKKLLEQTNFVPIGVVPHSFGARESLNLFRRYRLNIGEPILAADLAAVKNAAKRPADLHILLALMGLLPEEYYFEEGGN